MRKRILFIGLLLISLGCFSVDEAADNAPKVLRVAVTTSTRDSGLLDGLIPLFEQRHNARVDVIAVGTGAALKLGESGDVDVVLVHARVAEDAFMRAGHAVRREDVMSNMFEILGPNDDPASIRSRDPVSAFRNIAASQAKFVSRGDDSGTHKRELKIWRDAGVQPAWDGYVENGQGMGATLIMADQMNAYVLVDRGTYLKFRKRIQLVPLVEPSGRLHNPYGVMVVDPARHSGVHAKLANAFVDFMVSAEVQQRIADYRIAGQPLFFPRRELSESNADPGQSAGRNERNAVPADRRQD